MSNVIPPLISSSPPPMVSCVEEDEEDDFGNFTSAVDVSAYSCDALSLPSTPPESPKNTFRTDINSNMSNENKTFNKDFQDKRKPTEDHMEANNVNFSCSDQIFESLDVPSSLEHAEKGDEEQIIEHVEIVPENLFIEEPPDDFGSFHICTDSEHINQGLSSVPFVDDKILTLPEPALEVSKDTAVHEEDLKQSLEFADFESALNNTLIVTAPPEPESHMFKYDFDAFATASDLCEQEAENDDEFGDFNDFRNNCDPPVLDCTNNVELQTNLKGQHEAIEDILKQMFPDEENPAEECLTMDFAVGNHMFDQLKDITETSAVRYTWSKSSSHSVLLKSLNIDTRNILHGVGWNLSMPMFAANLGSTPLEPVKSEILTPVSAPMPKTKLNNGVAAAVEVPKAQFDWNGSGLTNPLDYSQASTMLLDIEHLNVSLDIPPSYNDNVPQDVDIWEYWLHADLAHELERKLQAGSSGKSRRTDTESVKSLRLSEPDSETTNTSRTLDDLSCFESPKTLERVASTTMVPLRETHIIAEKVVPEIDDDFSDFQTALPARVVNTGKSAEVCLSPETCLQPFKAMTVNSPSSSSNNNTQINWPDPGLSGEELASIERSINKLKTNAKPLQTKTTSPPPAEDDWSDFVSSNQVVKPVATERTSTPELRLCIPQLNNLQPPKQPVPVLTPHGLLQTKIPVNSYHPPPVRNSYGLLRPLQPQDGYHPSIISNHFTAECTKLNNAYVANQISGGFAHLNRPQSSSYKDDDWTDFVSSPPLQPARNGVTPNIITNPSHFESFRSFSSGSSKNAAATVSIPEFDFVTPKAKMKQ